jgi:hypothetical protein
MKRRRELDAMHARLAELQADRLVRKLNRMARTASSATLAFRRMGDALADVIAAAGALRISLHSGRPPDDGARSVSCGYGYARVTQPTNGS